MKRALSAAMLAAALVGTSLVYAAGPAVDQQKFEENKQKKEWMSQGGERDEALNLKPNKDNGRDVYEVCSACHQPEGWGLVDGTFPQLAGQHRSVIIKQLADIRDGHRDNPTMYPFALPSEIGGTQAIADVSEYIAILRMNPENGVGKGDDLVLGAKLYADNCVRCHGPDGAGNAEKFYPRIQGQHYEYLVRQYRWIKEGKRRNSNPEMVEQIKNFSDKDTLAVLDYVSRLKPPADLVAPKGWKNPDFK
ncbi:cytochrome C [Bradyrhizobium sp. Y36]|uniref:c-type cytochrome n=1 Tax=Bradyrhizobium sp. Y36 TaxID=2035447 RepID=UPI000BE9A7F2|nr:c-type cytochrome [Bradyrhizobium sp. Y36]PDT90776.1 cytochrome C [Bradyrhizobium sp. Y36]